MGDGGWAPEQIGGPFGTTFVRDQYVPADEAGSRENVVSCGGIKLTRCTPARTGLKEDCAGSGNHCEFGGRRTKR